MELLRTLQEWRWIGFKWSSQEGWSQTNLTSCGPPFSRFESLSLLSIGLHEGRDSSSSSRKHWRCEADDSGVLGFDLWRSYAACDQPIHVSRKKMYCRPWSFWVDLLTHNKNIRHVLSNETCFIILRQVLKKLLAF